MAQTHYQSALDEKLGYDVSPSWPCKTLRKNVSEDVTDTYRGLEIVTVDHELPHELAYEVKNLCWVVGGDVNSYLASHLDREVKPPETFQELIDHKWDPYVGLVSGTVPKCGYGIGQKKMEGILRVIAGDSRYNASSITVFGCGTERFIVDGPRGILLGKPGTAHRPSDTSTIPTRPIETAYGTFATVEGSQVVRTGIKRILEYTPEIVGSEPTSLSRTSSTTFIHTGETTVRVDHSDLRSVGLSVEDSSEVLTDSKLLSNLDESAEVGTRADWEPEYDVGEKDEYGSTCIGYRVIRRSYESRGRLPQEKLPGVQSIYATHAKDEHASDRLLIRRKVQT